MAYRQVIFNSGAPVDPNDFNQLQDNITSIFAQTNSLYNSVVGSQSDPVVPLVYIDTYTISVTANTVITKDIPLSASFTDIPIIIATWADEPSNKDDKVFVSASAKSTTLGSVSVISNSPARTSVKINYVAIQMKKLSTL